MRPRLGVACNDPDTGLFDYKAPQLSVFDAEFEALNFFRPPKFVETGPGFRLSGKAWPVASASSWVGNWCWNEYSIGKPSTPKTAGWWMVDFLKWLRSRNLYEVTLGTSDFCLWFNKGHDASDADIHTMIYRQKFH